MANPSLALASIKSPMERIFEKVMLRKMTEEEKIILHLNGHGKPSKKPSSNRAGISHKNG
jgi:hypothetical protein